MDNDLPAGTTSNWSSRAAAGPPATVTVPDPSSRSSKAGPGDAVIVAALSAPTKISRMITPIPEGEAPANNVRDNTPVASRLKTLSDCGFIAGREPDVEAGSELGPPCVCPAPPHNNKKRDAKAVRADILWLQSRIIGHVPYNRDGKRSAGRHEQSAHADMTQ
jgi:hypothetical protein